MPDQATVEGKTLVLNGMGLREATFLKVAVYVAGLYLESKSADANAILGSSQVKRISMHFVRDVRADQMRYAGKEKVAFSLEKLFVERKKASDYPQELLDLFHEYQHGHITRRDFLERA